MQSIPNSGSDTPYNTYVKEISISSTPSIKEIQDYLPGQYDREKFKSTNLSEIFKNFKYPKGFIPDFTQKPIKKYTFEHTLLGPTEVEIHSSVLEGRTIRWAMAKAKNTGQIWIESIYYPDSPITSYGTRAEVLNSGALTNKPLEYTKKTENLKDSEKKAFNNKYTDITPLLNNLEPIKQYRAAIRKR